MDEQTDGPEGSATPGWHVDSQGTTRWWDGNQWGQSAEEWTPQGGPPPFQQPLPGPPGGYPIPPGVQAPPTFQQPQAGPTPPYQQPQAQHAQYMPALSPPPPPWGSWTWPDGSPIDMASLPPYDPGKKVAAGVLAILLGGFGVHKFILGYTGEGVIMLVLVLCAISPIIGLIEGIIYLTKSDPEFYWTYVAGRKPWF
ncbi:MAG: NINE protein [Microthrixaceae bacterium]